MRLKDFSKRNHKFFEYIRFLHSDALSTKILVILLHWKFVFEQYYRSFGRLEHSSDEGNLNRRIRVRTQKKKSRDARAGSSVFYYLFKVEKLLLDSFKEVNCRNEKDRSSRVQNKASCDK